MTDREYRLRLRIDELSDERDYYKALWQRAAVARNRYRRHVSIQRRRAELWRHRALLRPSKPR